MNPTPRLVALVLPLLLLTVAGHTRPAPDVYENSEFGIRFELPEGWTQAEEPAPGMSLSLTFLPPADAGTARLTLMVAPAAIYGAPETMRAMTEKHLAGQEQFANLRHEERRVAGQDAPALVCDATVDGMELQLEQIYVEGNGHLVILQSVAPVQGYEEQAVLITEIWSTFEITAPPADQQEWRALEKLAARCGSEVAWAETWEDAAARAREEKKLILVHARIYRSFVITDEVMSHVFMDPTIVELVNERYVPFQLGPDLAVPFAAHDVYGMSDTTFGNAALLVTPDGEVVSEASFPTYEFLLSGLTADPAYPGPPAPHLASPVARAAMHLRRGENELAEELLANPDDAYGFLLRAKLRTWFLRGEEALADLERARGARGDEELDVDLDLQEAIVLTGLGRAEDAEKLLARIVEQSSDHPRASEASYFLGALRSVLGDRDAGEELWKGLIATHPDDRWSWLAAATLTSTSYALVGIGRLDWGEVELYATLRPPTRAPLPPTEFVRGEAAALEYLLAHQRTNGAWLSGQELAARPEDPPHDFQLAATAICGQSLLPFRENEEAARAVERAIEWLLPAYEKNRTIEMPTSFMDYAVWSRAYVLWFLADCVGAGLRDVDTLRPVAEHLVRELEARQKPGGGWSYYLSSDLATANDPGNWAMSFTTAAIVLSLVRAQEVGFAVPEEMLARSLGCMESMRNDNGTFEYMRGPEMSTEGRDGRPGAAGRGPVCAHSLYRAGRGSLEEIRATLGLYVEHRAGLTKEAWKILMHTGPEAQGSHYALFDYATIAAALRELPPTEQVRFREAVLEELLKTHCEDGSFQGNPLLGAATSTGLALLAFTALHTDG